VTLGKKISLKCPLCGFTTEHFLKKKALDELIEHIYYRHEQDEKTTYLLIVLAHAREYVR
jgi:hypothetical protein